MVSIVENKFLVLNVKMWRKVYLYYQIQCFITRYFVRGTEEVKIILDQELFRIQLIIE